ncbi:uncharacterized protein LOC129595846 [Paramacrobiotus metropolitanus]|uniref:uncharacterized protein LOC129595846 n=1 Tax=Paramacrobiotus metropolitanus TaxID=2943436 RepID=UPI0024462B46|nr:uncharacterized protein LOC129595846 [Paramacrobiotus metropolitanus]
MGDSFRTAPFPTRQEERLKQILKSGIACSSWKTGKTVLLFKKGDFSSPANYRPITLTSCIGKLFHSVISKRIMSYCIKNGIIDTSVQKGFIEATNGCGEHSLKLLKLIEQQRTKGCTMHVAWLDVANAYGSVRKEVLLAALRRYNIPDYIINYIDNYYTGLTIKSFHNESFSKNIPFNIGVFQGDTMSCALFLVVFNAILEFLKENKKCGVAFDSLPNEKIVDLAFADDLTLITNNKTSMSRLLRDVNNRMNWIGFKLQPAKCRCFSLSRGVSVATDFAINGEKIEDISSDPMKFLGVHVFNKNQRANSGNLVIKSLDSLLTRVDNLNLRSAFKVKIYKCYVVSCMRFVLAMHDLSPPTVNALESTVNRYLKRWIKVNPSANCDFFYVSDGCDLKSLKSVYAQAHAGFIADALCSSDDVVVHLASENIQAACANEPAIVDIVQSSVAAGRQCGASKAAIRKVVNKKVSQHASALKEDRLQSLVQQGAWREVVKAQIADTFWKSCLFDLPEKVIRFMIEAALNISPSFTNLLKWGKTVSAACDLCGATKGSLCHILNCCPISLNSHRYTWRHNSILKAVYDFMTGVADHRKWEILSDLNQSSYDNHTSTIPVNVLSTSLCPDLCCINRAEKRIILAEVTVPFDTINGFNNAEARKRTRYASLVNELTGEGWHTDYYHLAVGSRGMIARQAIHNILSMATLMRAPSKVIETKSLFSNLAKVSINCSYVIFLNKSSKDWTVPSLDQLFTVSTR